jgi:CubicO group peptidase (beta-lactamase class C family)
MTSRNIVRIALFAWLAWQCGVASANQAPSRASGPTSTAGRAPNDTLVSRHTLRMSDAEIARRFDGYMRAKVKALQVPGAALVVLRDGRPILARGYGFADVAARRPVDPDRTLFRAASISKTLPWILVMQLVDEGRLDLDRDVNDYLDFELRYRFGRPITLRQLMTHTAGFGERFHGVFDPDASAPLGTTLRDNVPDQAYPPGSTVAYSNFGAALAGYIVERSLAQPWPAIVQARVFGPAGMHDASVAQPPGGTLGARLASTYEVGDPRPAPFRITPLAPMGSLSATPADMARLLAVFMRHGEGANGRVLSPRSVSRMASLARPLAPGLNDGMGLGLLVGERHGVRYAGHAGNMTSLATDMEFLPDLGLGWYYVFNSQGPREGAREVRDDMLAFAIDRIVQPVSTIDAPPRGVSNATDVVGGYISTRRLFSGPLMFSGLVNETTVDREGDGLRIETAGRISHWRPDGPDRFRERDSGEQLVVTRRSDGRVRRIASAALYPVAEFERPPVRARLVGPVAITAALAFAFVALGSVGSIVRSGYRRLRGGRPPPTRAKTHSPRLARLQRWARWALLAAVLGWAGYGVALGVDFGLLFAMPAVLRWVLTALAWATLPIALVLAVAALHEWRHVRTSRASRFGNVAQAVGAICVALLFYGLDVVSIGTDW